MPVTVLVDPVVAHEVAAAYADAPATTGDPFVAAALHPSPHTPQTPHTPYTPQPKGTP